MVTHMERWTRVCLIEAIDSPSFWHNYLFHAKAICVQTTKTNERKKNSFVLMLQRRERAFKFQQSHSYRAAHYYKRFLVGRSIQRKIILNGMRLYRCEIQAD